MKKVLLFSATVLLLALAACNGDEKKEDDKILLNSPASVTVSVEGDIVSIAFNASTAWTATSSADWLTLNTKSGAAGDASLKASASKNETNDEREAVVSITAGTASTKVTVVQSQTDAIRLVGDADYVVEAEGGEVEITVSSNVSYEVQIPEAVDWIHTVSSKGMTDSKVVLAVDGTHLYDADCFETGDWDVLVRSANVTIKGAGIEQVVRIGQKTFAPYFDYEGDWANLQWSYYDGAPVVIPQEGADILIDIATNIEWRAYFSVWDNDLAEMVDAWDLGWAHLSYDVDNAVIELKIDPNETYFARENYLYTVGLIDGEEDGNFGGLGWFRQEGLVATGAVAQLDWQQSLADMGIAAGYNRLAYKTYNGDALLLSDGTNAHAISPADGTYWKKLSWPVKASSIASDDAGNVIVAEDLTAEIDWNTGALTSGTELTIYYGADVNNLNQSMKVVNKDYGVIGGLRVRGDLSQKAVITGVAGSAACWFGYEINHYAASDQYQGPGPGVNAFGYPMYAASVSLLPESFSAGVLMRAYDGNESLYYLADAYTPHYIKAYEWQYLTNAGNGGSENQNNMDIVEYQGRTILAYTQGFHFSYSGNAAIYILDVTDVNDVKSLTTIESSEWLLDSAWTGSASADVLLHPTEECLELYAVQSGKNTLAKFKIILN